VHEVCIDPMIPEDWPEVRSIYEEGIATRNATFEAEAPSWEHWDAAHIQACRVVARAGKAVLGWGALSQVSRRECYSGVAEVSVPRG
jgi:L-amino acid N-acyltransferase YncA